MSFDAADFLAGLFGDGAAAVASPGPAPMPAAPAGEADAGPEPFEGWVLRPDVTGRMGWEPPDLPEERRWRARLRFEDLPTLAAYFPAFASRPEDGPCPWCGRRDWWRSQAWPDVVRCGRCSPPAPGVSVVWLNRPEAGPAGKSVAQAAGYCVTAGAVDT